MRDVNDRHREAMALAERADLAKLQGEKKVAESLSRQAYEAEEAAAMALVGKFDVEPTRSVLFRSAAALALECSLLDEAERLASLGLGGRAPAEIAAELREISEEAGFRHHLSTAGVVLSAEELQVSMTGPAISVGIAQTNAVLARVRSLEDLILRTAERKAGAEYRTVGRRRKTIAEAFTMFMGVPRAGSFAFSVRLGESSQPSLPGLGKAEPVIDEVFECLKLFATREDELRKRITSDAYFGNFVSLARKIAPDGQAVRWVGLTKTRRGKDESVELRSGRPPAEMTPPPADKLIEEPKPQVVRIRGTLRWANALLATEIVQIVGEDDQKHRVRVPPGYDDIVKPFWLEEVVITGRPSPRGSTIILENIEAAPSGSGD